MKVSRKLILASVAFASFASCSRDPSYMKDQLENKSLLHTDEKPGARAKAGSNCF